MPELSTDSVRILNNMSTYPKVSAQTRTDIIGALEFALKDLSDDYSPEQISHALRYMLATDTNLRSKLNITRVDDTTYSSTGRLDPFILPRNDLALACSISMMTHHHHHHHSGGFHGHHHSSGISDVFKGCNGEALLVAAACVCVAVLACMGCLMDACYITSNNSNFRKGFNVGMPYLLGVITFILGVTLGRRSVDDLVRYIDPSFEEDGYVRIFAPYLAPLLVGLLVAIITKACFMSSCAVYDCVEDGCCPSPEINSIEDLAANIEKPDDQLLRDLQEVKNYLKGEWLREGDDHQQVVEFVKLALKEWIQAFNNGSSPSHTGTSMSYQASPSAYSSVHSGQHGRTPQSQDVIIDVKPPADEQTNLLQGQDSYQPKPT